MSSVIVKRLLKIRDTETPTRRKRVVKSDLPALKAKQFVGKKRNVAKEKAQLASALKDKLLKAQYDTAEKKLNARSKTAKAEFAEMNIADTPERRAAREAKEATQLASKNAPSTQQMLLEYLRENDKKAANAANEIVAHRARLGVEKILKRRGRPVGSKNKPAEVGEVKAEVVKDAMASAGPEALVLVSPKIIKKKRSLPARPPTSVAGSPAAGIKVLTPAEIMKEEARNQKAREKAEKAEEKAREREELTAIKKAETTARNDAKRQEKAEKRALKKAAAAPVAVAKAPGDASSDEAEGAGFNRALIGKGEQLHAGKQKVYMSETMADLDTLNRHNQRTVIPKRDIVDVERFLNTTLQNRAIPIRNL